MTHIVQRFERRLRQLSELSPKAYSVANEKIKEIYRVRNHSSVNSSFGVLFEVQDNVHVHFDYKNVFVLHSVLNDLSQ